MRSIPLDATQPRFEDPARRLFDGEVVGGRYRIADFLGRGGAGTVWRAQDLLNGPVAIKRLHKTVEDLVKPPVGENTPSSAARHELALSLAHEFQTLASVRHPHVISVLDYGFDAEHRPYLAMDLLEDARHLVQAGVNQPLDVQVDLLVQTLQALAYLHRRGIIHRDLKPANVLVARGQVKVLDFGLAVGREQVHRAQPGGTPGYLAPELFEDQPPSEVTDLFSVGAMACQMIFGRLPFDGKAPPAPPDFPEALHEVLERLVSKDSRRRPRSADEVIAALCAATHRPVPAESVTTRESFLQAARYVGRARELSLLSSVLDAALLGHGGGLLVGGESGVGKSRLLDELRPLALVRGAVVLRGQAVAAGGSPYQEWRPVLRWLSILTPLDDREASILKPLVPDLELILGRAVPDPAELGAEMAQARLLQVVEDIFSRLTQPTVVLLEDLHWAHGESLLLLSRLAARATGLPLLLLGSFRDDEAPTLPTQLPGLDVLRLPRLDAGEIAVLSESMIGPAGGRPHLVELLRRETEGNPFFLVEVARALAEEAGGLDRLGDMPLPERVFAGGVRRLVRRRLEKVSASSRDLLRVAAIVGRQVDVALLRHAAPGVDVERWLSYCAAAAVLDVADGHWRFAHDKLREGVLEELAAAERPLLHRRVAEAMEAAHRDGSERTAALCYHWGEAGDSTREAEYAQRAGEEALRVGACREALPFLARALERVPARDALHLGHLEALLAEARFQLGELAAFRGHAERALRHFGWPVPTTRLGWALGTLVQVGLRLAQSARPDAYDVETEERRRVRRVAGRLLMRLTDAFIYGQEALPVLWAGLRMLNLCEPAGASSELARGYTNMAVVAGTVPVRPVAEAWVGRAREVAERMGNPADLAYVLCRNAVYSTYMARWAEVEAWLERAIGIVDSVGDLRLAEECRALLTVVSCYQGKFHKGLPLMDWLEHSARRRGALQTQHWALHYQGYIHLRLGEHARSRAALEQTVVWTEAQGGLTDRIILDGSLALLRLREGDLAGARMAAEKALAKLVAGKSVAHFIYFPVTAVAEVLLTLWELEGGRDVSLLENARAACRAVESFARVFPFAQPAAKLWRGLEAWLSGDAPRAYEAWRECVAMSTAKETAYEEARARFELARHLPPEDPARRPHLTRALERFEHMGAQDDLARARVLQSLGA
ncbi:AAA family ATPase [Myxococcus llanfairpwllgwyngyllgogerychwyrndrobwllllantysiliogogogochensis]|uniref:AAA family ATPase n=1 Tax=Myxococcus llanfairpwllgwyngyllgogerychwyrndrobwllllantysiliogogogochensis TaxID=2590453 RepID=A0A540WTS8_9BACT|nr:serine/threonine-protein kinase [Myxococcus llanfairpwllgwyngyllgogerychwyrndrobwllllantysiliogogogochensis]TQF12412.1 AAA family ATPase [Myxococcus llanfairpwllgwyngyllgogerychwyrndrobwllllantysiliogogogochensis]